MADNDAPSLLPNFARRFLGRLLRRRRTRIRILLNVYKVAESGDTDLLDIVLQQMNVNEKASALETMKDHGVQFPPANNRKCTPLMIASYMGHVNAVNCLVKHGADINAQNKQGDTALHFAVRRNSLQVAYNLLTLGATQLYNNERLTPLLLASKLCMTSMVDTFIERPECTKEQRIDALEFLGASCATRNCCSINDADTVKAFQYVKRGMEERFQDPPHPLLKQPMEPVEAYQNRKESQTPEELAQIEGDVDAILMESLTITERILGTENTALHDQIRNVALYCNSHKNFESCIGLHRHLNDIVQRCGPERPILRYSAPLYVFYNMIKNGVPPRQQVLVEFLEQAFLEYERVVKIRRKLHDGSREICQLRTKFGYLLNLLDVSLNLLHIIAKVELCEADKSSSLTVFLRKLSCLNPCDENGDTLLHLAAVTKQVLFLNFPKTLGFPCAKTVTLLVNTGFNVNAVNNNGDTPLHTAVTLTPSSDEMHVLTDILEILLDGGAHHDFVNNDGKTAMDMAATHAARRILSERKTLELKCIAARAMKKFGLPYLGVVPKTLEKYISMH